MNTEGWIAVFAAAGTLISAIFGGIVLIMQTRAKTLADTQTRKLNEHERMIVRQEKYITRQDKVLREVQESNRKYQLSHTKCREENAELYGWLRIFRDGWVRMAEEVSKLTHQPPAHIPELPHRDLHAMDKDEAEFIHRTDEQNIQLVDKLNPNQNQGIQRTNTPLPPTK